MRLPEERWSEVPVPTAIEVSDDMANILAGRCAVTESCPRRLSGRLVVVRRLSGFRDHAGRRRGPVVLLRGPCRGGPRGRRGRAVVKQGVPDNLARVVLARVELGPV